LPNGKVLVVGGTTSGFPSAVSTAELYDPETETWTAVLGMKTPRLGHTATLLANGCVLVAGGMMTGFPPPATNSVELYDPGVVTNWSSVGILNVRRYSHTSTLLPDGRVLIAGGFDGVNGYITSAETFDVGLGASNAWRAQITAADSMVNPGSSLTISGTQFRGISSASGGGSQDSATDSPLLQLRSVESGQMTFLPATNRTINGVTAPVWDFPPGYALATIFVNGIQSTSAIVNISVPVATTTAPLSPAFDNGRFQFAFTNNPGAVLGILTSTNFSLPIAEWSAAGGITEFAPGQFRFTDPLLPVAGARYFRLYAP